MDRVAPAVDGVGPGELCIDMGGAATDVPEADTGFDGISLKSISVASRRTCAFASAGLKCIAETAHYLLGVITRRIEIRIIYR
jgi:hypothetical protein